MWIFRERKKMRWNGSVNVSWKFKWLNQREQIYPSFRLYESLLGGGLSQT